MLSQLRKQVLPDKCIAIVYDAIVLSKVLLMHRSNQEACKSKLTNKQYNFMFSSYILRAG